MIIHELHSDDLQLIEAAREITRQRYEFGKHHVGAAVRTKSDKIITAVHVEANIGRISVCAEAITIGKAVSDGDSDFDTIVAVLHPDPDNENRGIRK